jgi:predicted phosphate transport protein (TIGR00153 family)
MPKEERFHELLDKDTAHLVRAARVFSEIAQTENLEDRKAKVAQLKALEHDGDLITKEIFGALNSTFITPLDREDIRSLAVDLDDILDYLEGVAQYLIVFEIAESPDPLRKFAQLLAAMVDEIHTATGLIWDLANEKKTDLFRSGKGRDPVEILKWKEIYQGLEDACDECKEFTHTLSNVVVKNA